MHFLIKNLSLRLARKGLTINAFAPGVLESQMMVYNLENIKDRIVAKTLLVE